MTAQATANSAPPRYRPLRFGVTRALTRHGAGGAQYLSADQALQAFDARMSDRLAHWARSTPDVSFMAQRARQAASASTGLPTPVARCVFRVGSTRWWLTWPAWRSPSKCPCSWITETRLRPGWAWWPPGW